MKQPITAFAIGVVMLAAFAEAQSGQPASKEPSKPAPRLSDGKVDFGGKGVWAPIWVLDWANPKWVDKAVEVPFTPSALAKFNERRANLSNAQTHSVGPDPGNRQQSVHRAALRRPSPLSPLLQCPG